MNRCNAKTSLGKRCSRSCDYTQHCWQHGGSAMIGGELTVMYDGTIVNGQELTSSQTANQPNVSGIPTDGFYTLVMYDPDAPVSKASGNQWLHWLVANINAGNLAGGNAVISYQGPTPPAGSGVHNYIFGLYRQNKNASTSNFSSNVTDRASFNLNKFVNQAGLQEVDTAKFMINSSSQMGGSDCIAL